MENSNKNFFSNFFSASNLMNHLFNTVLALVFGALLQPIFGFLLDRGYALLSFWVDKICRAIATEGTSLISFAVFYLLYMAVTIKLIGLFTDQLEAYRNLRSSLLEQESKLHSVSSEHHDNTVQNGSSLIEDIPQRIQRLQNEIDATKRKVRRIHIITSTILIIFYSAFVLFYASVFFIHNKATMLTNNIEIVSPYISDIEYKTLKSNFHTMQNLEDFNNLMEQLNRIADENSLHLQK